MKKKDKLNMVTNNMGSLSLLARLYNAAGIVSDTVSHTISVISTALFTVYTVNTIIDENEKKEDK